MSSTGAPAVTAPCGEARAPQGRAPCTETGTGAAAGDGNGAADSEDPGADAAAAGRDAPTLLALMWLASPALPVGAFSYSEGLEAAVDAGIVSGEADAVRWLLDQLDLALARCDLPLMLRALDAWRRGDVALAARLNDWVRRTRESSESLGQSEQTGRSLAGWLRHGGTAAGAEGGAAADARVEALAAFGPAPTWPVAFALAAAQAGATSRDAALAFAFGWAENMAQAAMKAVPLGQAAAQRVLGRLAAAMPATVDAARRRAGAAAGSGAADGPGAGAGSRAVVAPDASAANGSGALPAPDAEATAPDTAPPGAGLQAYAPMWAILSSRHEVQYSRLFRS